MNERSFNRHKNGYLMLKRGAFTRGPRGVITEQILRFDHSLSVEEVTPSYATLNTPPASSALTLGVSHSKCYLWLTSDPPHNFFG